MDVPKGQKQADFIYKKTPQKNLMLTFLPPLIKKYKKSPVYFLIPGGGWHSEKRQSMIEFSKKSVGSLRNEGFAVVSIDYRVCTQGATMSEIITDCFDAARYVSHFADILEIDNNNFVLSGHSAGAHLALMLSYAPETMFRDNYKFLDKFTIKAVAAISPPTILYDDGTNNLRGLKSIYLECDTEDERKRTSPITYVKNSSPATLLCAGTSDYLVFANSSERLYQELKKNDVPCELRLSVGGGHCFEKVHDLVEPSISHAEMQDIITEFILMRVKQ